MTELEVCNALKRRALAFDLVGICTSDVMANYHADLLDHLHAPPPPVYSAVSAQQILRADRAAFSFLSEWMTTMKRNALNQLPMDNSLPTILSQPTVAFHLPPLAGTNQPRHQTLRKGQEALTGSQKVRGKAHQEAAKTKAVGQTSQQP